MPSLLFIAGILMAVTGLGAVGVLLRLSGRISWFTNTAGNYGIMPDWALMIIHVGLGFASAVIDNVRLTTLAAQTITDQNPWSWSFLAYCVGTGGSIVIIGSVAGVVVMGLVPTLSWARYTKLAAPAALAVYASGAVVFAIECAIFA